MRLQLPHNSFISPLASPDDAGKKAVRLSAFNRI